MKRWIERVEKIQVKGEKNELEGLGGVESRKREKKAILRGREEGREEKVKEVSTVTSCYISFHNTTSTQSLVSLQ